MFFFSSSSTIALGVFIYLNTALSIRLIWIIIRYLVSNERDLPKKVHVTATTINPGTSTGSRYIDDDSLYDSDDEGDVEMDNHGSVIMQILGQIKIGMDLTKVVLPTFILERRSLLEMYADFFAHPDIFVSIAELKTPRERIMQVVKWYLTSFHAGRKSAIAKKPYNPVLGELFKCYWQIPDAKNVGKSQLVTDGPIPWANRDQLTFIAEQVSHHPPISAFYAEHHNKRISFNAHIYTKSKLVSLSSLCVYNIGKGVISVLDHDEEYIVTFPNGYARSFLMSPWIELGGSVTISCSKTGYYSNLEFITKPFYGNKKHRISAEVFQPNDKKPFVSIAGEWNGVMEAKWLDKERTEAFVNVNDLSIIRKEIKPIGQQDVNESRRLWKEVTRALKLNDNETATDAKCLVEQIQRDEELDRRAKNMVWEAKLFLKESEDSYQFKKPLRGRIL